MKHRARPPRDPRVLNLLRASTSFSSWIRSGARIRGGEEGGRGKAVYGGGGVFGNPFAAGYGAKSAKTMAMGGRRTGGNRRRVGWYKANRASQEDSFAPPFLPFPPLPPPLNFPPALFTPPPGYLLSYFARPGIVFSCLLILALLFRVTLTTNLCFLSPL